MKNPEKQITAIKSQTIGVEVEMNSITRERAAKIAAEFFGTGRSENTAHRNGYRAWSAWDAQGREWKFQYDCSIAGIEDQKCELVTPILNYSDIETLQELIRRLRKAGAKSDATRGWGVNIRMAQYCRVVDERFLNELNRKKPSAMTDLANIWYGSQNADYGRNEHFTGSPYHMPNLHATFTKGTVEFRLFQFDAPSGGKQNGLHAGQLKSYIQLCLALSALAKNAKSASPKPQQTENPKYAMRTWLLRLGFIGNEFKTARETFTKRLDGDSSFRRERTA